MIGRWITSLILIAVFSATTALAYVPMDFQSKPPGIRLAITADAVTKNIANDVQKLFRAAVTKLPLEKLEETLNLAYGLYFNKLIEARIISEVAFYVDIKGPTYVEVYFKINPDDKGWKHIWIGKKPKDNQPKKRQPRNSTETFSV